MVGHSCLCDPKASEIGTESTHSKLGTENLHPQHRQVSQHGQSGVGREGSLGTDMVLNSEPLLGLSGA